MHHYQPQWVNSLWPRDAIWRQRSGSTLAQLMACCLMAPSHYLNQCWLIIHEGQWHSYQGNFTRDASTIIHQNLFENYMSKISFKFPRGQWVKQQASSFCPVVNYTQRIYSLWLNGNKSFYRTNLTPWSGYHTLLFYTGNPYQIQYQTQ